MTTIDAAPSSALLDAMHLVGAYDPEACAGLFPPALLTEAAAAIPAAEAACRPATAERWRMWLARLAVLPQAPADVEPHIAAMMAAHPTMPGMALNGSTAAAALRTLTWWPTPAAVGEVLAEAAAAPWRRLAVLRKVAAVQPALPRPAKAPPDPEWLADFLARLRTLGPDREPPPPPRASYLTPEQLGRAPRGD